jgi:hypothetical protein
MSTSIPPNGGLLLSGRLITVEGLHIVPPASHGGPSWNALHPGDFATRAAPISLGVLHTTGGNWPQPVLPGAGEPGHARQILDMWAGRDRGGGELVHSAAPLVVDLDGTIYCAADIAAAAAYHAQAVNARSVGIEMCTHPDGAIRQATLEATALLVAALTWSGRRGSGLLPIPAQMPRNRYEGKPMRRLELKGVQTDGRGLVGVIGHRDQTSRRGYGDPGDVIWSRLAAWGFEPVDYDAGEDLQLGRARQATLRAGGARIDVDGIVGPASLAAAAAQGYRRWRDVPAAAALGAS